MRLRI